MSWHGHLSLNYRHEAGRTLAHDRHEGPLRVLQRLYPEGDAICHHVLVHPPGGVAGGDVLAMDIDMAAHAHALITTPGATRFYKSTGALAEQSVTARLAPGSRLEWLPLETIAYPGCVAANRMRFELAPGAQMMGWDMLALGLPAAAQPFDTPDMPHGSMSQHIELPGIWLDKGVVTATDRLLLDSPLGWAGHRVLGTLWVAGGLPLGTELSQALLDSARQAITESTLGPLAGVTSPDPRLVVCRALADRVEPLMNLFAQVRLAWRDLTWNLRGDAPRIWRM